jgi:amidase
VTGPARGHTDELASLDATAQADLVRRGAVSPDELVAAACQRIEALDPELGAVPIRLFDEATQQARRTAGSTPYRGVPFLLKDVGARQAGHPYYAGNRALRDADHRAAADTPLGSRFRHVGLVTIGKSSAPEFGLQSNTWPLVYGPTRNPWDPTRSAGGSSGGACAAVAAGLVPVAHASDGAGSIRIPAAWCGLVGLKPSRDRIVWRHAGTGRSDVEFVVARSLRDTAAFVDALCATPAEPGVPGGFAAALTKPPPRLRVGVCLDAPSDLPLHDACRSAAERVAAELQAQGHAVEVSAPVSLREYEERALHGALIGPAEYRSCLDELAERLGRPVSAGDVEPYLWELSQATVEATPAELEAAARWGAQWIARTLSWFDAFDLLLTPTVNEPAPLLHDLDPTRLDPMEMLRRMVPHMAFTEPWNATGQPAISLPLGQTADGLPVGVQLVTRPGQEALLLSVAATLMDPMPDPSAPRPGIHA